MKFHLLTTLGSQPWVIIQEAYFLVHSLAVASNFEKSFLYWLAISGTNGSSGLGSVNNELIERRTFGIVKAGLHSSFKIDKQMEPLELMFGW